MHTKFENGSLKMKSFPKSLAGFSLSLFAYAIAACSDVEPTPPAGTGGGGADGLDSGAGRAGGGAGNGTAGAAGRGTGGGGASTVGAGGAPGGTGGTSSTMDAGCATGDLTACSESATPVAGEAGACAPALATHGATAVDRACWAVSASKCLGVQSYAASGDPPIQAIDSNLDTRYTTGEAQTAAAHALVIDFKSALTIDGLNLDSNHGSPAGGDTIVNYEIDVSTDKTTWRAVACGSNNTAGVLDIGFASTLARYVRIIQLQNSGTAPAWWSLFEVNAYLGTAIEAGADARADAPVDAAPDVPATDAPASDAAPEN
jgi:hypothetical protein